MRDPFGTTATTWRDYATLNSYLPEEEKRKLAFVSDFTRRLRPRTVWDLGCNAGLYSETALRAGAEYVVGFDSDHGALSLAVQRSLLRYALRRSRLLDGVRRIRRLSGQCALRTLQRGGHRLWRFQMRW